MCNGPKRRLKSKLGAKLVLVAGPVALFSLAGCSGASLSPNRILGEGIDETYHSGFIADKATLALVKVGSSKEQVLLSLGTPSARATFANEEVFYYISQTRYRAASFLKPTIVNQTVRAYYFNKQGNVDHIGIYRLKDGHVFEMISKTTPTAGKDLSFLQRMLTLGTDRKSIGRQLFGG